MPELRPAAEWTDPDLAAWFQELGLCRLHIAAGTDGAIAKTIAPPVLLLGRDAGMARACPHPDRLGYPEMVLAAMTLDNYHLFLLRWLTRAVEADLCQCYVCRQPLRNDAPDAPWDGIFIDKDLVAWVMIHFDCKNKLKGHLTGLDPFAVRVLPPEMLDVTRE